MEPSLLLLPNPTAVGQWRMRRAVAPPAGLVAPLGNHSRDTRPVGFQPAWRASPSGNQVTLPHGRVTQ